MRVPAERVFGCSGGGARAFPHWFGLHARAAHESRHDALDLYGVPRAALDEAVLAELCELCHEPLGSDVFAAAAAGELPVLAWVPRMVAELVRWPYDCTLASFAHRRQAVVCSAELDRDAPLFPCNGGAAAEVVHAACALTRAFSVFLDDAMRLQLCIADKDARSTRDTLAFHRLPAPLLWALLAHYPAADATRLPPRMVYYARLRTEALDKRRAYAADARAFFAAQLVEQRRTDVVVVSVPWRQAALVGVDADVFTGAIVVTMRERVEALGRDIEAGRVNPPSMFTLLREPGGCSELFALFVRTLGTQRMGWLDLTSETARADATLRHIYAELPYLLAAVACGVEQFNFHYRLHSALRNDQAALLRTLNYISTPLEGRGTVYSSRVAARVVREFGARDVALARRMASGADTFHATAEQVRALEPYMASAEAREAAWRNVILRAVEEDDDLAVLREHRATANAFLSPILRVLARRKDGGQEFAEVMDVIAPSEQRFADCVLDSHIINAATPHWLLLALLRYQPPDDDMLDCRPDDRVIEAVAACLLAAGGRASLVRFAAQHGEHMFMYEVDEDDSGGGTDLAAVLSLREVETREDFARTLEGYLVDFCCECDDLISDVLMPALTPEARDDLFMLVVRNVRDVQIRAMLPAMRPDQISRALALLYDSDTADRYEGTNELMDKCPDVMRVLNMLLDSPGIDVHIDEDAAIVSLAARGSAQQHTAVRVATRYTREYMQSRAGAALLQRLVSGPARDALASLLPRSPKRKRQ